MSLCLLYFLDRILQNTKLISVLRTMWLDNVSQLFRSRLYSCLLFFPTGSDYGGTGSKVFSTKPDCLLHHGGGRWTETSDRSGRGLQTNVGFAEISGQALC